MAKPINDGDFYQLKDFIYTVSNIELKDKKKYLVEQRLEPLLEKYKLDEYSQLIGLLFNPNQNIIDEIISAITTNETSFFRDKHVFDAIKKELFHIYIKMLKMVRLLFGQLLAQLGKNHTPWLC